MAAALLQQHAMGRVEVRSAGSAPGEALNPVAVAALAEWRVDMSTAEPKLLTDAAVEESDLVITMGCGDACPFYPGKRYLDWELTDPAGKQLDEVRPIRDEIDRRVRGLLADLLDQ
jgi:protein-tyrosine-phosphatase